MFPQGRGHIAALMAGAAFVALAAPRLVHAQTATALPPIEANLAPAATAASAEQAITGEALLRRRGASADSMSIIENEPGVSLYANGGISSLPAIRGLGESRVLVSVDGVQITAFCPNSMNPPGSYVSPSRVDAISVLPTLSPVSAGGDNIAGVIAIITKGPVFAQPDEGLQVSGEIGATYRSVADAINASAQVTVAGPRASLSYEASWNRAENYRTGGGDRVRSTLYEAYDQALTLGVVAGEGVISLRLGKHFAPYEGFPTQRMDLTENDSVFADLRYEGAFEWGDLTARASWRSVDHEMNFLGDKGGSATGGMPMNGQGRDLSAAVAATVPLKNGGTFRAGLEAYRADLDDWWPAVAGNAMMGPQTYWNITDGRRERIGAWGEWEARPATAWTTLLGLRVEHVETTAGPVQPYAWTGMMNAPDAAAAHAFNAQDRTRSDDTLDVTAKAVWRPNDTAALEFGYARKTRAPNLYERYAWGVGSMSSAMTSFAGDANGYVGDPDLKPEVAHHFAATLRLTDVAAKRGLTVTAYHSQVQDFVDAVKLADLPRGFVQLRFTNMDARLFGFDAAAYAEVWNTEGLGRGTLSGSLAFVDGENRDTGDNLYHMQPLTGRVALEQQKGRWTNQAEIQLVGKKDAVNALRNEPQTSAYALFNLRTTWAGERVRVNLAVENLLDTAYRLPLGGVSYGDYRADNYLQPLRPLPGPGRSFNLGLTAAF
jgi:iron complex outermembrane receptor protein